MSDSPARVVIASYDPNWFNLYASESERIQQAISEYITNIEHIGSTAVPGLAAKPIIDILIGVHALSDDSVFIPLLVNLGYVYFPEYETDLPERRYLDRKKDGEHLFHLHIVEPASDFFHRHLVFRDYLRTHPETASEYAALKYKLAAEYGNNRSGYTDAKTDFIQSVVQKAQLENK